MSRHSGGSGPPTKAQLHAAIRRIDQQLEQVGANEKALTERRREYEDAKKLLQVLPEKLTHSVMVPFGPLAFFRGHLEHTNEVLVQLSSEYFVLRTAKHALSTVEKRLDTNQADLDLVKRERSEIQQRRRVAAGEVGPEVGQCHDYTPPDAPVGTTVRRDEDGYFDIREPLDELEPGDEVRDLEHREVEQQSNADVPPAERDILSKLRDLEELEEQEERDKRGERKSFDGLEDLDELMAAYEREPGSCHVKEKLAAEADPRRAIAQSPGDIQRMMQCVDEAVQGFTPFQDGCAPQGGETAGGSDLSLRRQQEADTPARAFAGQVDDHEVPRAPTSSSAFNGQIRESEGSPNVTSTDPDDGAPKRISKFKAARQQRHGLA